jgi:hypothetical protein
MTWPSPVSVRLLGRRPPPVDGCSMRSTGCGPPRGRSPRGVATEGEHAQFVHDRRQIADPGHPKVVAPLGGVEVDELERQTVDIGVESQNIRVVQDWVVLYEVDDTRYQVETTGIAPSGEVSEDEQIQIGKNRRRKVSIFVAGRNAARRNSRIRAQVDVGERKHYFVLGDEGPCAVRIHQIGEDDHVFVALSCSSNEAIQSVTEEF